MNLRLKQIILVWALVTFTVTRAQSSVESAIQELSSDLEQWKRDVGSQFQETEKRAEAAETEVFALKRALEAISVPPIGFIYIEYGNQSSPGTLWPTGSWTDVSSSYAGLFFTAVGGKALDVGEIQEDWCPRISELSYADTYVEYMQDTISPQYEKYTEEMQYDGKVKTGGYSGSWTGLKVFSRGGEVRPKNQAVRLWQRTA